MNPAVEIMTTRATWVWAPVAARYRTIARLLLVPERLELARAAGSAIAELVDGDPAGYGPAARLWDGHGAALCAFALTVWEELRGTEHDEEARDAIPWPPRPHTVPTRQYLVVQRGHRWTRPAWWGDDAVHAEHRALLIGLRPEYETVFADWRRVEDAVVKELPGQR